MKKLINNSKNVVHEMLRGLVLAHPELTKPHGINSIIYDNKRKVTLISGGGSGHEPLDIGYVGEGLLDAAVIGEPFTPPTADQIVKTAEQFSISKPILFIVKNFEEDIKEFENAGKKLEKKGYVVKTVIVNDDASVDPDTKKTRKRGVAGTVLIHKILGAAATRRMDIFELVELGKQVNENLFTLGVALTGSELPGQNKPTFELNENQIFYGIGIHGERGYRKEEFTSSELLGRELVNKLVQVSSAKENEKIVLLINGLGNLPMMESFIFTNDVNKLLQLKGINPVLVKTSNYLSSYNMDGVSITVLKIRNDEWLEYINQSCGGFGWY
ncbi:dihydroxyacetone kinase subunit DhaK [Companilactobacillus sp. DQM5]|uniref:dihydroxyacetone kinase subunit DhaK n=1 Tax=Companilactobacillus sp. DQM5 TaxID=3463359 RepID=UPI004057D935